MNNDNSRPLKDVFRIDKSVYPVNTGRLLLAPYRIDFSGSFYRLKQLPETHRYNYSRVLSKKEADNYVKERSEYDYVSPKTRFELAVLLKKTSEYIGYIGFKGDRFEPDETAEIYYTLHPDYFGQGLGTESVIGMLDFGFNVLRLHRIWAGATCGNTASWKIMEKAGMRRECIWIKDRPAPGKWVPGSGYEKSGLWEDGFGYAILREEFLR